MKYPYITLEIQDAPYWVEDMPTSSTTSVLVNGIGNPILSETVAIVGGHTNSIPKFVEMLSRLSLTHILTKRSVTESQYSYPLATLTFVPSLDGTTNIDAKKIASLVHDIYDEEI